MLRRLFGRKEPETSEWGGYPLDYNPSGVSFQYDPTAAVWGNYLATAASRGGTAMMMALNNVQAGDFVYAKVETKSVPNSRRDWWRCDGCGHANDWDHLSCAHCGAQLPARYDQE